MTDVAPLPEPSPPSLARRIVAFPLTLMLIAVVVFAAASLLANLLIDRIPRHSGSPMILLNALAVLACMLPAYWLFCRFVAREPMVLFARTGAAKELAAGVAAGLAAFSAVVAIVALLGGYHVAGWGHAVTTLWAALAMAIISGFAEELLFRGILFRYIEQTAGSWAALAATSALFGAAHLANPNASLVAAAAIAAEAGILLGAVYMLTRRLWAAMGLHAAWNFTQGWVFGLPVSGGGGGDGLVRGQLSGPEILTGGAFGLEASLAGVIVATSAGVAVLVVAARRGEVKPPMWKRRGETVLI
ncbi:MAG TPA: CPBP family intramembrane glutamic endopeptidase [Allosphingosinicella sp.]|nr:CPBP family intramembrane glutamic endopeptidase [Allosphingosinicella sp.]